MTTRLLFREDAYQREAEATLRQVTEEGGLEVDASVFYPTGGGQPGDSGSVTWEGGAIRIETTVKGPDDAVILVPAPDQSMPPPGARLHMALDWERRYALMRVHTALHLMSVAIPFGVTGGAIGEGKGRLDFDMAEPPADKEAIAEAINRMIATDAPVQESWITEAELDAQPDLVKTMKVQPPRGAGRVRLIEIGTGAARIDLQPCGGTHVKSLGEIGPIRLGKVEKKGRMNRRVTLHLDA